MTPYRRAFTAHLVSLIVGCAAPWALGSASAAPNVLAPEPSAAPAGSSTQPEPADGDDSQPAEVVVKAERLGLIGTATTSSQGVVTNDELALTPAFRPGQLLETVPGLVVTSHSGEGKANQYLLRGFNLDHGTDLAVFVDGMPVNEPTHAHGQGYTDLNFMIPELATNMKFTKGPYFASIGDFGTVGSVEIGYLNTIEDQVDLTAGTLGFRRLFGAYSTALGGGTLLGALEAQHYDGPWVNPDDQRKVNAVLRYSSGDRQQGYSVTAMFYHGLWNATTDQPVRAVEEGLISRFGSLDPSDGGQAQRASLSGEFHGAIGDGELSASAYLIGNHLTLWNDFTHYLVDPVNGDQEAQHEDRRTGGAVVSYSFRTRFLGLSQDVSAGLQGRFDSNDVSRLPTRDRQPLPTSDSPLGFSEIDQVHLADLGLYADVTTYWTGWLRSVLGLREDYVHESDSGTNAGSARQTLLQPKGSLIFTPFATTELYLSAGRGFHTDDARGVNQARLVGLTGAPVIARSSGEEVGIRQQIGARLAATMTVFRMDFESETTYDPDVGQDSAGPASRRTGAELNVTYQALRWLEVYGSIAGTHARFTSPYDDGTGHVGYYIPDAPKTIGNLALYVRNLGRWSGGLEYRYFGSHPLTPDNAVRGDPDSEWNADLHYMLPSGWNFGVGLFNLFGQHGYAAEYWYVDRLPGEPADGVAGEHFHPLEPFSVRVTIGKDF